jgi:hypothetical protein
MYSATPNTLCLSPFNEWNSSPDRHNQNLHKQTSVARERKWAAVFHPLVHTDTKISKIGEMA